MLFRQVRAQLSWNRKSETQYHQGTDKDKEEKNKQEDTEKEDTEKEDNRQIERTQESTTATTEMPEQEQTIGAATYITQTAFVVAEEAISRRRTYTKN